MVVTLLLSVTRNTFLCCSTPKMPTILIFIFCRPSLEEIRMWADSFDRLMKNRYGRNVFREFLKCEYSEENILFWLACEDLKKETNPEKVEEKARIIYEDYISILSPKEVVGSNKGLHPAPTHAFSELGVQHESVTNRFQPPHLLSYSTQVC
ncbi:hypothetical protein QYM36_002371 [Artemia franciscana]|uniref:RGS domain-containing protein n=1 Tax=Artemia franciscana TaxID=6661 RepID=A0AA88LJD2_ARTSF|nr:hypothetical protein QYM36_002371 [Artemia franciscana]